MSVEGRITVDALFHDADGTASLKVLSLESSMTFDAGVVAVVSGTAGTATAVVSTASYRNAAGETVSLAATRLAFVSDNEAHCQAAGNRPALFTSGGQVAVTKMPAGTLFYVFTTAGTATYRLLMWGET
jgi:hypothetical protein